MTSEDRDRISALLTEVLRILKSDAEVEPWNVSWSRILNQVALWYNVSVSDILSLDRSERMATARWVALYYCAKVRRNDRDLGLFFRRDRTSVIYALQSVAARAQVDRKFRAELEAIGRVVLPQDGVSHFN